MNLLEKNNYLVTCSLVKGCVSISWPTQRLDRYIPAQTHNYRYNHGTVVLDFVTNTKKAVSLMYKEVKVPNDLIRIFIIWHMVVSLKVFGYNWKSIKIIHKDPELKNKLSNIDNLIDYIEHDINLEVENKLMDAIISYYTGEIIEKHHQDNITELQQLLKENTYEFVHSNG